MAKNFTTMRVQRYTFEYDFDTRELRLSWTGGQTVLGPDETIALGDFLFEVMSTQGRSPRILPLTITGVETTKQESEQRSGECVECGRFSLLLSENGYCEGCVMQAAIDAMEPEERWK